MENKDYILQHLFDRIIAMKEPKHSKCIEKRINRYFEKNHIKSVFVLLHKYIPDGETIPKTVVYAVAGTEEKAQHMLEKIKGIDAKHNKLKDTDYVIEEYYVWF